MVVEAVGCSGRQWEMNPGIVVVATDFETLEAVTSRFKIVSGAPVVKPLGTKMALMFLRAFALDMMAAWRVVLGRVDAVVCGIEKNGFDAMGMGWLFERTLIVV
jgi:hypothetical protein